VGLCSDTVQIARPQWHKLKLTLIVMAAAMIAGSESLEQALIDPGGVAVECRGAIGVQAVRPALIETGGQIIILSSARKQVTMDGQTARLGGRLGAGTVTGISDSQLTMRVGGRYKSLSLYARVEKRITNAGLTATTATVRPGAAN